MFGGSPKPNVDRDETQPKMADTTLLHFSKFVFYSKSSTDRHTNQSNPHCIRMCAKDNTKVIFPKLLCWVLVHST